MRAQIMIIMCLRDCAVCTGTKSNDPSDRGGSGRGVELWVV